MNSLNNGALSGIRIVDITWAWAGPFATALLAYLGAEVIKIESRKRPDHSRLRSLTTGELFGGMESSPIFNYLNQNKLGLSLDLSHQESIELVKRLVRISDVVVQNMRPGVIDRLGLGYEELVKVNPTIVFLSSSARGITGPESTYIGYAPNFGALGGVAHLTGYPHKGPSRLLGEIDLISATTAAFAIVAALNYRARTGRGQHIDLSSSEAISSLLGEEFIGCSTNKRASSQQGNRDDIMAPHNCYPCQGRDRWISIAVANEEEWQALCNAMGRSELADDGRFATASARCHHQEELDSLIAQWTKERTPYEVMKVLQKAGVAAVPSFTGEDLFYDPHLRARGFWRQVDHPTMGKQFMIGPPWKLSATPVNDTIGAPLMGQHNEYVLGELLGLSQVELERLIKVQIVY